MTCAAVEQLRDRNAPVVEVPGVLALWLSVPGLPPPLDECFVCFLDLWPQQKRCGSCHRFIMIEYQGYPYLLLSCAGDLHAARLSMADQSATEETKLAPV